MKTSRTNFRSSAFTLIELLVVIAIIAILAAMLFPAIGIAKRKAAEASARADMANIGLAINRYEADYNGRFPAPGIPAGTSDVTYGYVNGTLAGTTASNQNAQVIAILMDVEKFNNGNVTSNANHVLNPRRVANLNAKFASDNTSQGVGSDGEYRDPWGGSYVISMDTSLDDRVRDHLYSRTAVSHDATANPPPTPPAQKGYYGLFNPTGGANQFEFNGKYLIWSRGADGKANPAQKAKDGDNKDNLLSWQ